MPRTTAPLVLVVGMHRSGTSLLGALLQELGVATPGPLIAGDDYNPEGYVERHDITALQEQLLIDLDRWWPSAAGAEPLPAGWLDQPATSRTRSALHKLLQQEVQRQRGPWAIKDPRTSLLLPLWRELAEELAIPLRLVMAVRDPREVAISLLRRDAALAGMTAERAQRLWWHHNRQLLLDAAELPLEVIDYGRWFGSRDEALRQIAQLQAACGLAAAGEGEAVRAALSRINPEHRRSRGQLTLLPGIARLQRRLQRLSRNPDPSRRQRLVAQLRPLRLPPPIPQTLEAGSWFDPNHYLQQRPDLRGQADLLGHYLEHGWQENEAIEPHPLFSPAHYRHEAALRGLSFSGNPLTHFLEEGMQLGLAPSSLVDPAWMALRGLSLSPHQPLRLARLHPWGAAAEALSPSDASGARAQLSTWLHRGFSAEELELLAAITAWPELPDPLEPPGSDVPLLCRGANPLLWPWHAWRQHLPAEADGLNLLPLNGGGPPCQQLLAFTHCRCVCDPDPARVALMRRLGTPAKQLFPTAAATTPSGWLQDPGLLELASEALGLPPPAGLGGSGGVLVLGSGGPAFDRQLLWPLIGLPGFNQLHIHDGQAARALAAWLQDCQGRGLQLLRLNPAPTEEDLGGFEALVLPANGNQLSGQFFHDPLDPAAIAEELDWRRSGCLAPAEPITPRPQQRTLWSHEGLQPPQGAIVISLYNYTDHIETALDSAAQQTLDSLELIVVDDASSDDGAARVLAWLERHGQRFARACLLQHQRNAGLAAARNTAFADARSPWCFVLDADNSLEPTALERSLAVAAAAGDRTAVVVPLVEIVRSSAGQSASEGLISLVSWQQQHFLRGNVVDAMALVRRQAWQAVGGYTHIPGGWEDFDFWCALIDAGWHGVLCPERLTTYNRHASSMLQQQTDRHVRRISRLLQARHPWLQLPMAGANR